MILHLDLDSFFASVEQALRPEIQGKPVAISAGRGQGVVTAASYQAKEHGVRVGMSFTEAKKKVPSLVLLPARMQAYRKAGEDVQNAIKRFTYSLESAGIDECYIALQPTASYEEALTLAKKIKEEIKEEFGLNITIGGGSSKVVAKLASDRDKPDGLLILKKEEEIPFLLQTEIEKVAGIGGKTQQKLNGLGVHLIKDILNIPKSTLLSIFGHHHGTWLYLLPRNGHTDSVKKNNPQKSISVSRSFSGAPPENLFLLAESVLGELLQKLNHERKSVRRLHILAIVGNQLLRKTHKFGASTDDQYEILKYARKALQSLGITKETGPALGKQTRIISVTVDGLSDTTQLTLNFGVDESVEPPDLLLNPDKDYHTSEVIYKGMVVNHEIFGRGVVLYSSKNSVAVRFGDKERLLELWAPLSSDEEGIT
ncbi:MAG: hypothetical protein ACKOW9_00425 [Candidatus Paceibacterota bacterium]